MKEAIQNDKTRPAVEEMFRYKSKADLKELVLSDEGDWVKA